jgi:hypothetical protein
MRLLLSLVVVAVLGSTAYAAERALRDDAPAPRPAIRIDAGRPLFALAGLRHGDRATRCVTLTNEGPGEARAAVAGRSEGGELQRFLRVAITRGCDGGTLLWSGRLDALGTAADPEAWPANGQRRYGIAIEVAGTDDEIQGLRATQEFAFTAEGDAPPPPAPELPREEARSEGPPAPPAAPACRTITFAPAGRKRRPVLVKRHRVDARVHAKLILRIYGAPGQQRLVLVTGLRIGRDAVVMGSDWGSVSYRVRDGAAIVSRRRPYRVRIAPGVLQPGRNVIRVTTKPKRGAAVRAKYVLNIEGAASACVIG